MISGIRLICIHVVLQLEAVFPYRRHMNESVWGC